MYQIPILLFFSQSVAPPGIYVIHLADDAPTSQGILELVTRLEWTGPSGTDEQGTHADLVPRPPRWFSLHSVIINVMDENWSGPQCPRPSE